MSISLSDGLSLANTAARGNMKDLRKLFVEIVGILFGLTVGTVVGGQAVVVSATKTIGTFLSITATTFIGNLTGNVTGNLTGNVSGTVTGYLRRTINPDLAAAGSTVTDAAQLLEGFTVVTGANGTLGVKLPATPTPGTEVVIKGTTAGVLKVWPDASATINAISSNGALSMTTGAIPLTFIAKSATQWYSIPLVAS